MPGKTATPELAVTPAPGGRIDWANPGLYQHIGYPSVEQMPDGAVVASYHEWDDDPRPLQFVRARASGWRASLNPPSAIRACRRR